MFILIFLIGFVFYFIPSIIAISSGKNNTLLVVLINVFIGWSLIGWVIALILSLTSETRAQKVIIKESTTRDLKSLPQPKSKLDEIYKLKQLLDDGAITKEEFEKQNIFNR